MTLKFFIESLHGILSISHVEGPIGDKMFRVSNWSKNPSEMPDPVIMAEKFYAMFLKNVEDSVLSAFIHFGLLDERPEAKFDPKA